MTEREPNMITADAVENTVENEDTFSDHEPGVEFSDRFKKRMNRLFREQVGTKRAMYPEVDSRYERVRSRLIREN